MLVSPPSAKISPHSDDLDDAFIDTRYIVPIANRIHAVCPCKSLPRGTVAALPLLRYT